MKHLNFATGMPGLEGIALEGMDSIDAAKDFHDKMTGKKRAGTVDVDKANAVAGRLKTIVLKIKSHVSQSNLSSTKPVNVGKLAKLIGAENAKTPAQLIAHLKAYNGNIGHVVKEIVQVGDKVKAGAMSVEQGRKVVNEDEEKLLDHNHAGPHPALKMVFTKQDLLHLLDAAAQACDNAHASTHTVKGAGEQAMQPATEAFFETVGKIFLFVFKFAFKVFLTWLWIVIYVVMIFTWLPTLGVSVILGAYVMSWINTLQRGIRLEDTDMLWSDGGSDDEYRD